MPPSASSTAVASLDMTAAGQAKSRPRSRQLVAVFSGTLFLSAFLMFIVEPMIARMVLPLLGGAASVWNTCLVFFQALLLCGYAYAHTATSRLGVRRHAIIHVCVVLLPLLVLPVRLANGAPPATENPVGWLLLALLMSVGLPFFVLSTSAAVLQKWYAATGDEGARDPYFLYAASNLGSFVALIAYPLVVERLLPLRQQAQVWTVGYGALAVMTIICAAAAWRSAPAPSPVEGPLVRDASAAQAVRSEAIAWGRRGRWVVLAFVPSSLLMAVTSYMSTDVAAVPLLWIVPLSLYLLTFTVAFSPSASGARSLAGRLMPVATIALTLVLVAQMNQPLTVVIPLHLAVFAIVALVCHGELANDRPSPARLTEFYFWIALGGMLGGLFNALVAPVVFTGIAEYPLVLVLACLIRPAAAAAPARESWRRDVLFAVAVGGVAVASVLVNNNFGSSSRFIVLGAAVPALIAFGQQRRPLRFALCVALLLLSGVLVRSPFGPAVYATRTFFGVYRVRVDEQLHYRFMFHGSTLHGMQSLQPERRAASLSYFHAAGPIGQVFANVPNAAASGEVAVVGLGVGSLASYAGPRQRWVFYEIDPVVERIARDPAYFTYLSNCGARCEVTIGDARLSLARARPQQFGVIILDAFSSDAIPIHLLTREALALYVSRLAPGGIIALHISNLHLSLSPVLGRLAQAEGLTALWQREPATAGSLADGKFPSEWMVLARDPRDLGRLTTDPRWTAPHVQASTPLWTDDFSNILSVLRH